MKNLVNIFILILVWATLAIAQPISGNKVTICQGNNCATVSASSALKVDGSAVTQPISGTVAATQSGTWNVNNISGTVSLPTGAATSALQTTGNTSLATIESGLTVDARGSSNGMVGLGYDSASFSYNSPDIDTSGAVLTRTAAASTTSTQTITANSQRRSVTLGENKFVNVDISGTYGSIAIIFEVSYDGGTNYRTVQLARIDANTVETASGTISSVTRSWRGHVGAATHFSVRSTAYTSGTMNVRINTSRNDAEPNPAIQTHAVTGSGTFAATQSGTWSTRAQDGSGNAIASAVALPGKSDRGFIVRNIDTTSRTRDAANGLANYVIPHGYALITTRTTTTGSTATVINVTVDPTTVCRAGDILYQSSGTHAQGQGQWATVLSVSSSAITLDSPGFGVAPVTGLGLTIYRPRWIATDVNGYVYTNVGTISGVVSTTPSAPNKTFFESDVADFTEIAATTGTLTTFYQTGNTGYIYKLTNTTDKTLLYSADGGSTSDAIPPNSDTGWLNLVDIGGNLDPATDIQVTYESAAPTVGGIYFIMGYY